ncbi:hypothetical protein ACHAXT_004896 [Thalassiosira profunda]
MAAAYSQPAAIRQLDQRFALDEEAGQYEADGEPNANNAFSSRRSKATSGTLSKVDWNAAYPSVNALEVVANLLRDARSYLEIVSRQQSLQKGGKSSAKGDRDGSSQLRLPCECLRLAIDGLETHHSVLSVAIENSSDMKGVREAQKKLMKSQRLSHRHLPLKGRDPRGGLEESLTFARGALDDILSKTSSDFLVPSVRRRAEKRMRAEGGEPGKTEDGGAALEEERASKKHKKSSGEGGSQEGDGDAHAIVLPQTFGANSEYSPMEACAYISNVIASNSGRLYIKDYKEEMIAQQRVPVKISQLNAMVAKYSGDDKVPAPLVWKSAGGKDKGWEPLLRQFRDRQGRGMAWSIDDTREALTAWAKENERPPPTVRDIEDRHRALLQVHERQNHIDAQIVLQEKRLKENPPKTSYKGRGKSIGAAADLMTTRFDPRDKRYKGIELPEPMDGNRMYTPAEMVALINNYAKPEGKPERSRSDVRAFKEKMIAEGMVPVSITQLNSLMRRYGGPDSKGSAPKTWNAKGNIEIISIDELVEKVVAAPGTYWTLDDTRQAVYDAKIAKGQNPWRKNQKDPEEVKAPNQKTVNVYHTALLSVPEVASKVVKPIHVRIKPGPKPKNPHGMY